MAKIKPSGSLDSWRDYFRQADSDVFGIIDHAIMVAASDFPIMFKSRRDRIAELLFSCKMIQCTRCNHLELSVPEDDEASLGHRTGGADDDDMHEYHPDAVAIDGDNNDDDDFNGFEAKESKVNGSRSDNQIDETDLNKNHNLSNYSYGEAEALTDEIEETTAIIREVTRIKNILLNSEDESSSMLFELLRQLQLMSLTVDILKSTEIGKAVNVLKKHESEKIRQLANTLITEWTEVVDEWIDTTKKIAGSGGTPLSANPSVVDEEEGLPSPPLDEGAFFGAEPIGLELGKFFDGMNFDGHWNYEEQDLSREKEMKPKNVVNRRAEVTNEVNTNTVAKSQSLRRQEASVRSIKPSAIDDEEPRRFRKQSTDQRTRNQMMSAQKPMNQRKPIIAEQKPKILGAPREKLKGLDDDPKFELVKRKLQESYQQLEKAKRQRMIQVLDTIPARGNVQKHQMKKPGMINRNLTIRRR